MSKLKAGDVFLSFPTPADVYEERVCISDGNYLHMHATQKILKFVTFIDEDSKQVRCRKIKHFDPVKFKRLVDGALRQVQKPRFDFDKLRKSLTLFPAQIDDSGRSEDRRLGYRIKNTFVVKAKFTFGLVRVETARKHIYETETSGVVLLMPQTQNGYDKSENRLNLKQVAKFKQIVLKAKRTYELQAGTHYVLLTFKKSIFTVNDVPQDVSRDTKVLERTEEQPSCFWTQPLAMNPTQITYSPINPQSVYAQRCGERVMFSPLGTQIVCSPMSFLPQGHSGQADPAMFHSPASPFPMNS